MPEARNVWQLAASPSSAALTRRLTIRKTSTLLIRRSPSSRVRVNERHSGKPRSAANELSVDPRERDALEALLAAGGAQLSCVDADTTSPTVAISSDAGAPVAGPFSITVAFSELVTGFELEDLVVGNGSASELQGNNASYMATITPAASGTVTVDIAAGAPQDGAGNPSAAAVQFSIVADVMPVPALPVIGALALLLLGGGARRRTATRRRPRMPHGAVLESAPDTWWLSDDSGDAGGGARSCRRWKSLGPRHHRSGSSAAANVTFSKTTSVLRDCFPVTNPNPESNTLSLYSTQILSPPSYS